MIFFKTFMIRSGVNDIETPAFSEPSPEIRLIGEHYPQTVIFTINFIYQEIISETEDWRVYVVEPGSLDIESIFHSKYLFSMDLNEKIYQFFAEKKTHAERFQEDTIRRTPAYRRVSVRLPLSGLRRGSAPYEKTPDNIQIS